MTLNKGDEAKKQEEAIDNYCLHLRRFNIYLSKQEEAIASSCLHVATGLQGDAIVNLSPITGNRWEGYDRRYTTYIESSCTIDRYLWDKMPLLRTLQMLKPFQFATPHHLSHTLETTKRLQNLTSFLNHIPR